MGRGSIEWLPSSEILKFRPVWLTLIWLSCTRLLSQLSQSNGRSGKPPPAPGNATQMDALLLHQLLHQPFDLRPRYCRQDLHQFTHGSASQACIAQVFLQQRLVRLVIEPLAASVGTGRSEGGMHFARQEIARALAPSLALDGTGFD